MKYLVAKLSILSCMFAGGLVAPLITSHCSFENICDYPNLNKKLSKRCYVLTIKMLLELFLQFSSSKLAKEN